MKFLKTDAMRQITFGPNIVHRTMFTTENLKFLRRIDDEYVDLMHLAVQSIPIGRLPTTYCT